VDPLWPRGKWPLAARPCKDERREQRKRGQHVYQRHVASPSRDRSLSLDRRKSMPRNIRVEPRRAGLKR
jgi:hypothetical protein